MNKSTNNALLKKIQVLETRISSLKKENLELKNTIPTKNDNPDHIKAELNRFQTIMDALDAVVYVSDMETYELLYLNKLGKSLTGDHVGEKCYVALQEEQVTPCDFCTNHLLIDKDGKPTKPHVWEFQNTKTKRWHHISDQAISWPDGRMVRLEIAFDITENKLSKLAMMEANNIINRSSSVAFLWKSHDQWSMEYVSKNVFDLLGYTEEEVLSGEISYKDLIHLDDIERVISEVVENSKEGKDFIEHKPYRVITKNEKIKWVNDYTHIRRCINGQITHYEGIVKDITQETEINEAILENRQLLKIMMNSTTNEFMLLDPQGIIIATNQGAAQVFGINSEELVGRSPFDFMDAETHDRRWGVIKDAIAKKEAITFEDEHKGVHYESTVNPIFNDVGKLDYIAVYTHNITDRLNAEREVIAEKDFSNKIIETSTAIIVGLDKDHIIRIFNKGAEKISGYTKEEVIGKDWFQIFFKEEAFEEMNRVWKDSWGVVSHSYINPVIIKNGEERTVGWRSTGIYEGEDKAKHLLISIGEDITDRIKGQQALKESEERNRIIVEQKGQLIYDYNILTEEIQWYGDIKGVTAYSLKELQFWNLAEWENAIHPDDRERALSSLDEVMKMGSKYHIEYRFRRKDDSYCYIEDTGSFLKDSKGKPYKMLGIMKDVTFQRNAENALKESEEKYRLFFENNDAIIFFMDPTNGEIIFANKAALKFYGYPKDQFVGKSMTLINVLGLQEIKEKIAVAIKNKKNYYIFKHKLASGEIRDVEVYQSKLKLNNKDVFSVIVHDITDRIKAEEKVNESEANLKEAQKIAKVGSWSQDLLTNDIHWSEETCRIFGVSPEASLSLDDFTESIHPDDRVYVDRAYSQSLINKEEYNIDFRILLKDGSIKYVNERCKIVYNQKGEPIYSLGTTQDITEIKKAHQAILGSEERYHQLIGSMKERVIKISPTGQVLYMGPNVINIGGYNHQEEIGKHISKYFHKKEELVKAQRLIAKMMLTNISGEFEFMYQAKEGHLYPVEISYTPILKNGKVEEIQLIMRDISERVAAEKALRKSEGKLRSIFSSIDDIVFVLDKENRFLSVNEEKNGLLLSPENFIGKTIEDIMPNYVVELFDAAMVNVKNGETQEFNYQLKIPDGTHWYSVKISPILSRKKFSGSVAVVRDISEAKMNEIELRDYALQLKERNEELDAFSHTVAHDLKNPIGVVLGFANVIAENFSDLTKEDILKYISMITKGGLKSQQIIESLLLFANVRKAEVKTEQVDMTAVVDESLRRLSFMIDDSKAVVLKPPVWPVSIGYTHWIEEVWTNYISNAIKYGGDPPHIEIGVDTHTKEGMLRFWVKDNGKGISEKDQNLLFKKFERLDETATDGHGLGLSIVRRITEKLGGQVGVESNLRVGSKFWFTLPAK